MEIFWIFNFNSCDKALEIFLPEIRPPPTALGILVPDLFPVPAKYKVPSCCMRSGLTATPIPRTRMIP